MGQPTGQSGSRREARAFRVGWSGVWKGLYQDPLVHVYLVVNWGESTGHGPSVLGVKNAPTLGRPVTFFVEISGRYPQSSFFRTIPHLLQRCAPVPILLPLSLCSAHASFGVWGQKNSKLNGKNLFVLECGRKPQYHWSDNGDKIGAATSYYSRPCLC